MRQYTTIDDISNLLIGHNVTKGEESDPSRQYSQFLLDFD